MRINAIKRDVHPDFWDLLIELQQARVDNKKETLRDRVALWKLSKTVTNMVRANPELFNALVEVEI